MTKARRRRAPGGGKGLALGVSPFAGTVACKSGGGATDETLAVVPHNRARLDEAREQWAAANWTALSQIDEEALENHPDRSRLAAISAASALQSGDKRGASEKIRRVARWGGDKRFVLSVLLASARHALGRASFAADRQENAAQHFQHSLFDRRLESEVGWIAGARADEVRAELATRRELAIRHRGIGLKPHQQTPPAWIEELVTRCFSMEDVHHAVDDVLDNFFSQADERVWFLLCLAEQFELKADKVTAVSCLNTAMDFAQETQDDLRLTLVKRLVAIGQSAAAVDMLVGGAIDAVRKRIGSDDADFSQTLANTYRSMREAEQSRREHGHELLLAHLKLCLPRLKAQLDGRQLSMVEVGTTRENVPGQGSTRKLAEFCHQETIGFVTVDMDPHNTHVARRMFERLSMNFQAVAMKGEDYFRARQEQVDFAFLDAYDFDHGQHSDLRQSRYVKYLGSRIDEEACHRMHLDCAQSLSRLLSPQGVICVDDTWLEDGHWKAKGTLAIPFLLEHGFEIIDARNRAALLRRSASPLMAA